MKSTSSTTDLTVGRPLLKILYFALPLVLGTLFQQLYSFVDTIIVGRAIGTDALAAVGATYSLHFLVLGFVQGTCVGFGIPTAQSFGAKDMSDLRRYFWNGTWLCIGLSILLLGLMTVFLNPLLRMMRTHTELFDMARIYMGILVMGIPASILYNYSASVLRAVGDSKHPFMFLLISSVLNILLDLLFIMVFKMGVAGAALATIISQLVSGVLNSWWMIKRTGIFTSGTSKAEQRLSSMHIKRLCLIGLPMGFEYSISAIGALVMQGSINTLGSIAVAAQTTGEKIRQMFTLPMESVGMAMATYAGQNYGAGKLDRIKKGITDGLIIQVIYSGCAFVVIYFIQGPLVTLVLGETSGPIFLGATEYLSRISTLFIIHGSLMIFRNTLQGLGYSVYAIISGVGELIGRSVGGILAVSTFGYVAICYANPLAWFLALCYCVFMVIRVLKKLEHNAPVPETASSKIQ